MERHRAPLNNRDKQSYSIYNVNKDSSFSFTAVFNMRQRRGAVVFHGHRQGTETRLLDMSNEHARRNFRQKKKTHTKALRSTQYGRRPIKPFRRHFHLELSSTSLHICPVGIVGSHCSVLRSRPINRSWRRGQYGQRAETAVIGAAGTSQSAISAGTGSFPAGHPTRGYTGLQARPRHRLSVSYRPRGVPESIPRPATQGHVGGPGVKCRSLGPPPAPTVRPNAGPRSPSNECSCSRSKATSVSAPLTAG